MSADWLREAGITARAEPDAVGPVGAFLAVRQAGHAASLNLLGLSRRNSSAAAEIR